VTTGKTLITLLEKNDRTIVRSFFNAHLMTVLADDATRHAFAIG
jgi:hypothetical protein